MPETKSQSFWTPTITLTAAGTLPIDERADVVSISHVNPKYHSDTSSIQGEFVLLNGLEYAGQTREAAGIAFASRTVYEDEHQTGPNAMVRLVIEGLTISHLGDLGHPLSEEDLEFLRGSDIVLALAGGTPTIDLVDLRAAIDELRPAVIIPMHYKTPKVNLNLLPLERFLEVFADLPAVHAGSATYEVTRATLPESPTVMLLEHAR